MSIDNVVIAAADAPGACDGVGLDVTIGVQAEKKEKGAGPLTKEKMFELCLNKVQAQLQKVCLPCAYLCRYVCVYVCMCVLVLVFCCALSVALLFPTLLLLVDRSILNGKISCPRALPRKVCKAVIT